MTLVDERNSTVVVETAAATCPNTVVGLHGAAPNVLLWASNPKVTAIRGPYARTRDWQFHRRYFVGRCRPCRSTAVYDSRESDYAENLVNTTELLTSTDPDAWQIDFVEGNLEDYNEFDAKNASGAFEYGFELSYTTFHISDLQV